jgi:hypothetical protein
MGELHGITVVVDTTGPAVFVGRCHELDERRIVLLDADVFEERAGGESKDAFVARAAEFGVWKTHDAVTIPRAEIASIRRLGDIPAG